MSNIIWWNFKVKKMIDNLIHVLCSSTQAKRWHRAVNGPKMTSPTRILIYQPVWAGIKPEIKKSTLNFEEILMKKKKSFNDIQSHKLRRAIFVSQQSRKPYHAVVKISILIKRPARLKPDNFSKSKPKPSPKSTGKARAWLTTLHWQFSGFSALFCFKGVSRLNIHSKAVIPLPSNN